ncbi:hypothetical protein Ddc_05183 [Ditylenchus destructor]|nr:hypothetical protein Ddc_05183 [Ditylenchus destructor]
MELNRQIREKVRQSSWRPVPYRNGGSPNDTFGEIVTDSFEEVKRLGRSASHCNLYDMYCPKLGNLRVSSSYSALQPSNGMEYGNRRVESDLRPFHAYKTKQGEWRLLKEKQQKPLSGRWSAPKSQPESKQMPMPPTCRRQYPVPADCTRFENFSRYWNGRAKGVEFYSEPFLHEPEQDKYEIVEDRRYERMYWGPVFIKSQPSARHARQVLLTAY